MTIVSEDQFRARKHSVVIDGYELTGYVQSFEVSDDLASGVLDLVIRLKLRQATLYDIMNNAKPRLRKEKALPEGPVEAEWVDDENP